MAACHARPADKPAGPWPGSPVQLRRWPAATRGNGAQAMHARGVITVRSSRVRASAVIHSTTAWWGLAGEHRWGPRVAPGRWSGGGAHPSGGSACGGGVGCRCAGVKRAFLNRFEAMLIGVTPLIHLSCQNIAFSLFPNFMVVEA
jgi:hypothetical protein